MDHSAFLQQTDKDVRWQFFAIFFNVLR